MTEIARFMLDEAGYLVIPNALTGEEVEVCLEATKRVHAPYPLHDATQA